MTIRIEHKNKVVEFYNVPGKVMNSIETLLHAIEAEKSEIISAEFEPEEKKKERVAKAVRELDPIVNACPCSKCSNEIVPMTCNKCDEYYAWIDKLKGEI